MLVLPSSENKRLEALRSYEILDTLSELEYDELTELASVICESPIALISLVDKDRQWFKSKKGLSATETAYSFCSHAIINPDEIMEIEDAKLDDRFKDNPLVTGDPKIAFYAGVPLINEDGFALGSLCVIDSVTKKLTSQQRKSLTTIAHQVMDKMELRRKIALLQAAEKKSNQLVNLSLTSYSKSRVLIEQAPVAIILFRGKDLVIEEANSQMLELLGQNEQIIGKPLLVAIPELEGQEPYHLLFKVFKTGKTIYGYDKPVTLIRNGLEELGYYNFTYSPLIENGEITGVIDMAVNVTEQVKARDVSKRLFDDLADLNNDLEAANKEITSSNEQLVAFQDELLISELRFRQMADNISQLAWMASPDGNIYWYNKRWYDYTGTTLEKMKGWGWQNVHHPEYVEAVKEKIKRHFESGEIWEDTFPLRDYEGNYQWFLSRAVPIRNEEGEITNWFGTNTEITEQIKAREKLEAAQKELRASFQRLEEIEQKQSIAISQAKLGTFSIDGSTGVLSSSPRLREIFGYLPEEEMSYEAALDQIIPEFRQQVKLGVADVFNNRVDFHMEYAVIGRSDGIKRWVKATGKLYRSESDAKGQFSGTILDITEQKEDDLRKSDFIAMVSHELKTPLTSLSGFMQVMEFKAKKTQDEQSAMILDKARKQIGKMTTLINGFLNVSRLESGKIHIEKQRFDMKELVKEIEEETVPANTSHHIIFAPVITTWVIGDRDKIGQVITNFISNALKYSAPGTTVQIACVAGNGCSVVSVRDEGMGIAEKDLSKLFDRYYRVEGHELKGVAGFGIGLYLCSEIIQRHNGKIWVESTAQVGSSFFFSVPVEN
ncbi:PAS domain S-box protein [Mucilaginibacter galii]|uniref:histidine kinase n=1 Tax=Mucilaginibacter galii TaxID=2005073 RepID=A0A917J6U4_9SPHI|nr:PAS domain S-box protein [Mucilaginibacter galii]GGI50153.1 hypothetical protein GCM10011425_13650 [Mucilaginibacter galii]